jgi:hypothetical protein
VPLARFWQLDAPPRLKWRLRTKRLDTRLVAAFVDQFVPDAGHGCALYLPLKFRSMFSQVVAMNLAVPGSIDFLD